MGRVRLVNRRDEATWWWSPTHGRALNIPWGDPADLTGCELYGPHATQRAAEREGEPPTSATRSQVIRSSNARVVKPPG